MRAPHRLLYGVNESGGQLAPGRTSLRLVRLCVFPEQFALHCPSRNYSTYFISLFTDTISLAHFFRTESNLWFPSFSVTIEPWTKVIKQCKLARFRIGKTFFSKTIINSSAFLWESRRIHCKWKMSIFYVKRALKLLKWCSKFSLRNTYIQVK